MKGDEQGRGSFFKRHKVLTGIMVFILLAGIVGVFSNDEVKEPEPAEVVEDTSKDVEIKEEPVVSKDVEEVKEEPAEEVKEGPAKEEPKAESVVEDVPREHNSALKKAESYANKMNMSKASVYDQLVSEYGEGFPADAAQYAIDNVVADWNENALQKAISYAHKMNMSTSAVYDQLVSEYGEQFTKEQAQYAIDNLD